MTEFKFFVSSKIEEQTTALFAQYLTTKASGLSLSGQRTLDLPLVPAAALGQAELVSELNLFARTQERGQLALCSEASEIYDSLSAIVPALLKRIDTSGNDATYRRGIDYIIDTFKDASSVLDRYRSRFGSFRDALAGVQGNYVLAEEQSAEKITGQDGEIGTLREKVKSLAKALDEVNGKIAAGATKKAVKDVELGLKAASAVVGLPGIGDLVMDTTFDYVNEAIGDDGDPLARSDALLKEYAAALLKLRGDIAQVAAVAALKANGDRFVTAIEETASLLGQASDDMANQCAVLQDFKNVTDRAEMTRQLSAGLAFWTAQKETASVLLKVARINDVPENKRYE